MLSSKVFNVQDTVLTTAILRQDNRVEQGFDNTVQDVENAPDNVAGWFGEKVGDVERFDDNVDSAYDQGRYEGRNDYDY